MRWVTGLEEGEGCVPQPWWGRTRLWGARAEKSKRWEPCLWLGAAFIPFLLGLCMLLGEALVVSWGITP